MVRKGDNYRFCIDFRRVNKVTAKDSYPMPNMSSLLDGLRQARYLSKIDLKQAFLQVPLADEISRDVTSFIVPGRGLFRFRVMPFGLTNAPATFQRLADMIFGPELFPYVVVFLDDILVCTPDFDTHCRLLTEVFKRLKGSGLRVNSEKCEFGCREVRYLGYMVNSDGMCVDPAKVESVVSFPVPRNVKELRRFLGMAGWYRRFIQNFSTVVSPLTALLRKKSRFFWSKEQDEAFESLKRALTSTPVLARPDFNLPFTLQTDASEVGLGAVLTQSQNDQERVIAYASRTLSPAEKNYSVTEKECLAVLWGIEKHRQYLEGYPFTVVTDHASLSWLMKLKDPSGRLARWSLRLQPHDFKIEYRKGSLNAVADALSRIQPEVAATSLGDSTNDDLWYSQKFEKVQSQPDNHPDWKVENGQLYYHRVNHLKGELADSSEEWKLVIPYPLRSKILKECHDEPEAGHLGVAKTHWRISRLYHWPGLYQDVSRYVRRCDVCQRVKPTNSSPTGIMQPRYNTSPWETVSIDIMGPLPRSSKGNVYVIVFQDTFTKWVEIVPVRTATSEVVIGKFRSSVLNRYGAPKLIITDNGTNFVCGRVRDLAKAYGFRMLRTPFYHAQANPVERANRNIKQLIVSYLKDAHTKWDDHLGELMFALNSVVQESTKFSPAFLNFGREIDTRLSFRKSAEPNDAIHPDPSGQAPNRWSRRIEKLKELYHLVEEHLVKANKIQRDRYNLRRRPERFKPGDMVLRRSFRLSSAADKKSAKLFPKFEVPFTIESVSPAGVCRLSDRKEGKEFGRAPFGNLGS